jgi:hypothetical protein
MQRRSPKDRRAETRRPESGRIVWQRRADREHVAWISDASSQSVSFVASADFEPSLGDRLVLTAGRWRGEYRVSRTADYGLTSSLIACRRVDGSHARS